MMRVVSGMQALSDDTIRQSQAIGAIASVRIASHDIPFAKPALI